jgi:hypothetical protein
MGDTRTEMILRFEIASAPADFHRCCPPPLPWTTAQRWTSFVQLDGSRCRSLRLKAD